jgi:acyl-coenzyme A synthetase/AMP-(fatty) acid ligase
LIPHVIDDLALRELGRTYALAAHTLNAGDTPQVITFLHLSHAINKCAFWLKELCGKILTQDKDVTIAYLSRSDLRTCVLIVAAIKVGIKVS